MRHAWVTLILLGFSFVARVCASAPPETLAERVVVLANSDDAESVKLARHYMEKRNVPPTNLVALPMPRTESIQWREFIDTIYQPIQDELVRRNWIQAIGSSLKDKLGRKKYAISSHRIAYLVVCRGVPLKIEEDPALAEPVPPLTDRAEFRTNRGAVDAELSLLARSGYPINALVPNPLFNKTHPTFIEEAQVVKVSRLDGPSLSDALALVDNAILAEQRGLIGRAYVDIGGQYPQGDSWLEATAREIEALNYDLDVDRRPQVFAAAARFDAPVLYFGWYAGSVNGPFAQPGFRFPPGAIALHIHSFSAQTLRSADSNWCGPLVARGVTATFGNVHEPYLPYTHHPHLLVAALAAGANLGDAAYRALPALSWQEVLIGDPLYRPFAQTFADQWEHRHELKDGDFAYVVVREANRLLSGGRIEDAKLILRGALEARPGLVLAMRLAQLFRESGDADAALKVLRGRLPLGAVPAPHVAIVAEMAEFFMSQGARAEALEVYQRLLALDTLSIEQRLALLAPAMKAAEAAGAADIIRIWKQTFEGLSPKPNGKGK